MKRAYSLQLVRIAASLGLLLSSTLPKAGGYVDSTAPLNPATAIPILGSSQVLPTFNNAAFTDQALISQVSNDVIRTPSTSDPVSTVNGNNYHDETDLVIKGRNGLNNVFTRTYNSAPISTTKNGPLGYGWTHSYAMQLKSNDHGDCPNCDPGTGAGQRAENGNGKTASITYVDERGGEHLYKVDENSFAVTPPMGEFDALVLDSPAAGQHTLTFRNGVKYIFETPSGTLKSTPDVVARLKFIDSAWGDRLTLNYDTNGRLSTINDNLGIAGRTGIVFTYHPDGLLRDVSDWTGRQWRFAYDASGNLQSMTNPLNQTLTYSYDAPKHLLTNIAKPVQRDGKAVQTKFKYYRNGRTFQQTNSFDVGDTLDYDLYRKSTRVTGPRGHVREYHYDENGRMTKLVEPDGGVLLFENQGDAIRSKKYDALGYATTYSYRADKAFTGASDQFGNVTREQDALGRTVDMAYGPLDQIATIKDKRGVEHLTFFYSVDGENSGCGKKDRPYYTVFRGPGGGATQSSHAQCWNADGTLRYRVEYINSSTGARITVLTYEAGSNGLNVSEQRVYGNSTGVSVSQAFTYDSLGRKKTETVKRRTSPTNATQIDLTTRYEYDALDRMTKATDSLGNEVINHFDANGQLWKVTHRYKRPDGSYDVRDVITRTFDAADRVKTETDAEVNVTRYTYDEAGNVMAVTDAENHTTRFEYDAMNRRVAVIDATGYRTETDYNLRGDVVGITNANEEKISFVIDALGRKTDVIDAKGYRSRYGYDENGNLTCSIDANADASLQPMNIHGCSQKTDYDELGRVAKITDALNGETRFTHDLLGNRLAVTDAQNKTWSFAYDELGRLVSETDHSGRTVTYKLDETGNVYEKTNRLGEVTRYSFDNGNRLTRVDYLKDNTAETFGYDPAGNLNAAANHDVGYAFGWDRLNRLVAKLDSRGSTGLNKTLAFSYDKVGNILTKTTYQNSTTRYVYNAANRLVMLQNPDYTQVNYQVDPAGRLLSRVTANGARSSHQYDANGWLTRLSHYDAANALVSDTSYTRDRVGNITGQSDAAGTSSYTLDALYRLTRADHPDALFGDELFSYDPVGNRLTRTLGSVVQNANTRFYSYTAGTNRLAQTRKGSSTGTVESSFTYDHEGRLITQTGAGAKTLSWDAKGRVKTVGAETYTYDPMDHRIGRSGGTLGNRSYYLEGEHLESEYSGSTLLAKYFRGSSTDELVAAWLLDTAGNTKPYLFHHDQVNSVTAETGHNGGITKSSRYQAFGQSLLTTGGSPSNLKYTGREYDQNGLYYYRARYYDPQLGRFISEDPMGFAAGDVNFYAYVGNNPINANDPSGKVDVILTIGKQQLDVRNQGTPGTNYLVRASSNGTLYPMGAGGFGQDPSKFTQLVTPQQTSALVDWGRSHIQNNRLNGATGDAGWGEIYRQSDSGKPWDTKQYLPNNYLYVINGKAELNDYVGNAIWATGVNSLGLSQTSALLSAHAQSLYSNYSLDDPRDQEAINFGYSLSLPSFRGAGASGSWDSWGASGSWGSAGGGFLLYPNKANANMMKSVYSK